MGNLDNLHFWDSFMDNMRKNIARQITNLAVVLFFVTVNLSCNIGANKSTNENQCILEFKYYHTDAVGPDGLVCFVNVCDTVLKKALLKNFGNGLKYKYNGCIYNIDSLYFPRPYVDIKDIKNDQILVFEQAVFCLRGYSKSFLDSIVSKTEQEISIEIIDTLNNKTWKIYKCR